MFAKVCHRNLLRCAVKVCLSFKVKDERTADVSSQKQIVREVPYIV